MSAANSRRFSLGVSWMILPPASWRPRWCWSTASVYCATVRAPGLYCLVRFPLPARAIASPSRVLQDLQSQRRLSGEPFDSSPSMWSITRKRVEPHKAHLRGEGGQHSGVWARYRLARSVIWCAGFLQEAPHTGRVTLPPDRLLRCLCLRPFLRCHRCRR